MKKLNKNKLDFTKSSITELNDQAMVSLNGGSSIICISISSDICVSIISAVSMATYTLTDSFAFGNEQANIND